MPEAATQRTVQSKIAECALSHSRNVGIKWQYGQALAARGDEAYHVRVELPVSILAEAATRVQVAAEPGPRHTASVQVLDDHSAAAERLLQLTTVCLPAEAMCLFTPCMIHGEEEFVTAWRPVGAVERDTARHLKHANTPKKYLNIFL